MTENFKEKRNSIKIVVDFTKSSENPSIIIIRWIGEDYADSRQMEYNEEEFAESNISGGK